MKEPRFYSSLSFSQLSTYILFFQHLLTTDRRYRQKGEEVCKRERGKRRDKREKARRERSKREGEDNGSRGKRGREWKR